MKEAYYITKNTSTSYSEVLDMSPAERKCILDFLTEEYTKQQEALEKNIKNNQSKR